LVFVARITGTGRGEYAGFLFFYHGYSVILRNVMYECAHIGLMLVEDMALSVDVSRHVGIGKGYGQEKAARSTIQDGS